MRGGNLRVSIVQMTVEMDNKYHESMKKVREDLSGANKCRRNILNHLKSHDTAHAVCENDLKALKTILRRMDENTKLCIQWFNKEMKNNKPKDEKQQQPNDEKKEIH